MSALMNKSMQQRSTAGISARSSAYKLPKLVALKPRTSRALTTRVQAAAATNKSGIAKFADAIGLPTDEGIFGFRPFSEVCYLRVYI